MANIDITDQGGGGSLSNGVLQLENGVAMDTTLRYVADQANTKSQLLLATNATTVEGTLKVKTNNVEYLDVEDGSGNNRFTISRPALGQKVTLDFASNPVGSTTPVGAIRTFQDGVNLSDAMTFIEDGSIGIGTTAPVGLLHMYKAATNVRLAIDGDTGFNRLISYRTGALPRWGLYADNTAESGSNAGTNFAIRRYNDAGTFIDAPFNITRSSGNIGINTATTTGAKVTIKGSGATSATNSLLVQNSSATNLFSINDAGELSLSSSTPKIILGGDLTITNIPHPTRQISIDILNSNLNLNAGGVGECMFIGNRFTTSRNATTYVTPDGLNATGSAYITAYDANGNITLKSSNNGNRSIALTGLGATGSVLIGNITTGNGSSYNAILRADSTTQGFLPPRMTTAQKNAIVTPTAGLVVYDTTLNKLCVYTTAWETITSL